jgi:hypothetical protein
MLLKTATYILGSLNMLLSFHACRAAPACSSAGLEDPATPILPGLPDGQNPKHRLVVDGFVPLWFLSFLPFLSYRAMTSQKTAPHQGQEARSNGVTVSLAVRRRNPSDGSRPG